jgi:hypothetical protein
MILMSVETDQRPNAQEPNPRERFKIELQAPSWVDLKDAPLPFDPRVYAYSAGSARNFRKYRMSDN